MITSMKSRINFQLRFNLFSLRNSKDLFNMYHLEYSRKIKHRKNKKKRFNPIKLRLEIIQLINKAQLSLIRVSHQILLMKMPCLKHPILNNLQELITRV